MALSFFRHCRLFALATLLMVLHLAYPVGAATPEEKAGARATAHSGVEAFKSGRYEAAVDYFTRAESIVHAPTHLLYIARAEVELGHLVLAKEAYLKLLHEQLEPTAPEPFLEAQESARQELPVLEPRIPSVTVTVTGASRNDVELYRNDVKMPAVLIGIPIPTDPGSHKFWAEAPGLSSARKSVHLKEGQRLTIELHLSSSATRTPERANASHSGSVGTDAAPTPTRKILGYSALSLGALSLAAGTYFALDAAAIRRKSNSIYEDCPELSDGSRDCSDEDRKEVLSLDQDVKAPNIIGIASLGVGAALVTTGVILLVHNGNKKESAARGSARVWPVVGPNGAFVSGRF